MYKITLRILLTLMVFSICFTGCKAKKKAVSSRKNNKTERVVVKRQNTEPKKEEIKYNSEAETNIVVAPANSSYSVLVTTYINNFSQIAKEEMLQYGIPASITLAQGILESGAGNGELTKKANNHFGIKCHREWEGDKVFHDDDESQECFRKYKDAKYSFRDHSLFLTTRSRYADLFKFKKDDYESWAKGLRKAGYATDPKYPDKLISIIERFDLAKYDDEVLGNTVETRVKDNSKIAKYTVVKGDTLYSLSRRFNIPVDTLKEYNGLRQNDINIGQTLYLHSPKN